MEKYTISAYITIMKSGFSEYSRQESAGRLLLESIAKRSDVNVDIDAKMITNLVKQRSDVHDAIKAASSRPEVIDEAIGYFNITVVPALNQHTKDDAFQAITSLLKSDASVPDKKRDELTCLCKDEKIGEFLARSFLYAINRVNKLAGSTNDNLSKLGALDHEGFTLKRATSTNKNRISPFLASKIWKKQALAKEFVNREKPRKIFYDIVNSNQPLDANIIVYHGIGGIGKSSLIKNLKDYLGENNLAYSAIDFDDPALRAPYSAMCMLEKGLGFEFPHFELAASIYFLKQNPDLIHKDAELPTRIAGIMSKLIKDSGNNSSGFVGIINRFYNKYGEDWQLDPNAKDELEELEQISPNAIEKRLVYFFALDLHEHLEAKEYKKYVMFFDTYELLWPNGQNDSNKLSTDAWVRQLASCLGNVIFVISGREELRWNLDKEFPTEKMIVVPLEMLSNEYAKKFLESCQITDVECQDAIITSSQGYPYYLDLCVDTYHKIANADKSISVGLFNGGFQEIQECFFKSLTAAERESLKVLSIPRFYDLAIFHHLITSFNTGYPVTSIDNFNFFSFVKSDGNGKNIIHALMRDEISNQLPCDLKNEIHKSMISFYTIKLNEDNMLAMDNIRYYFTELIFHLKNSNNSSETIALIEKNYLPIVKRFQVSGETRYMLENFEELFDQTKADIAGTEFFAIMADMIHLSGRYSDAVNLINNYLSKFTIEEIASYGYRLNLFIRKIHHQMFFVSIDKLQDEVNKILAVIDKTIFPEQYCEALFMMGAHILLPAGEHVSAGNYLEDMMKLAEENQYWGLLCRGLRKYAELLCAQEEYQTAEEICSIGLDISHKYNLLRYELYLQCVLGEIKRLTGNTEEALEIFQRAKPLSVAMGITGWIAHVEMSIGNCFVDANDFDAGLNSYNNAKNLYCSLQQVWGRLNAEIAISRVGLLKGEKIKETTFSELKEETERFGYKILTKQIEEISSGYLGKIQFEYL